MFLGARSTLGASHGALLLLMADVSTGLVNSCCVHTCHRLHGGPVPYFRQRPLRGRHVLVELPPPGLVKGMCCRRPNAAAGAAAAATAAAAAGATGGEARCQLSAGGLNCACGRLMVLVATTGSFRECRRLVKAFQVLLKGGGGGYAI